ncbi:MAG: hypothetical protein M9913_17085 [Bryobacteraceae bacterium]|nr:hypothetical protein [Solibacteraceae bacterium]MCO5352582.1 hypothetical protein [Bryobacteraceae bacterium]
MDHWGQLTGALNAGVLDAFGREVAYHSQAGGTVDIRAIFQPAREAEESAPGVYSVIFVRLADLPVPPTRGDAVDSNGVRYKVFDIEADTSGAAVLRLRKE